MIGVSFGGGVALDLAAARPERVAGLVLVGAGLPDHVWSSELEAFGDAEDEALAAGDLEGATDLNVELWLSDAPAWVRDSIREQQRSAFELQAGVESSAVLLTDNLPARLAELVLPALVVVGERDHADFQELAERLASALPNARRESVPGGHLPSLEQPAAFDAVARPFLAEVS